MTTSPSVSATLGATVSPTQGAGTTWPSMSSPLGTTTGRHGEESTPIDPAELKIDVELVVGGMTRLVGVASAGDGSGRLFLLEKEGRVRIVEGGELLDEPFLDITGQVESSASERGLLGIAFHPDFVANGEFFVNYTTSSDSVAPGYGGGDTIVSRFKVSPDDPNRADRASESVVIAYAQPYSNHNGGNLRFGPTDGCLYIGTGDGGSGGDPDNRAQDGGELLGKMLRIDVDVPGDAGGYAVPGDNPYVGDDGLLDEIWAYGLRNPWRYTFDALTGDMYIADVGQSTIEEVDFQPADSSGGENYGWPIMEGSRCYRPATGCDETGLVLPVTEYDHSDGVSITGGEVYRGARFPRLVGTYMYADYGTRNVWGLNRAADGTWRSALIGRLDFSPSSFGADESGEIYVVSDSGGDSALYHVVDANGGAAPTATAASEGNPTAAPHLAHSLAVPWTARGR